ncbi:MAG: Zn-dependent M28 family amino/carboxypeptidase, partial [bacterium]
MRKCTLLLLAVIFYSCAFTQTTKSLTSEVSLDSLVKTVREFSGEDSATFNDTTVRIVHRVSKRGNNLAADYLVSRLKAYGLKVETIDYRTNGRNVVGTLIGKTNPDSVYFISAHYDAVADYCADDNASGSATVLEAARIMSKYCFNNTIKFAFWDEEELGLIGSRYYADSAIANNEPILGVLNMDMMGYDGDSNKVFDIHTNSNPENQRLKDTVLFMLDMLNID